MLRRRTHNAGDGKDMIKQDRSARNVEYFDLTGQYESLRADILTLVDRVMASGRYTQGEEVERFEVAFARYCSVPYAVAVNSGTSALHLVLLALGIDEQSEVIVPALTFKATAASVCYCGAKPVFVDIDPARYTLDPMRLEAAISPRTCAIIPVHLYGQAAKMDEISDIARKHGLPVIEDVAQAHGGSFMQKKLGSFGVAGCFSFYPSKNLGTFGEGGAIITSDVGLYEELKKLRSWGNSERCRSFPGGNFRMAEIQAAVLNVKLGYLDSWNRERRHYAQLYRSLLQGETSGSLMLPAEYDDSEHVYHVYAVRHRRRDELRQALEKRGVGTAVHYAKPVPAESCFGSAARASQLFPVAAALAETELSLPLYPGMGEANLRRVAVALKSELVA